MLMVEIFVGTGPSPGHLAMLFPGQGSQYVGMLRELACRFPQMQAALAQMNESPRTARPALSDWIYPRSAFGDDDRRAPGASLARHPVCPAGDRRRQPGTAADSGGIRRSPDMVGGHSFGELTALCAAGRIDDRELAILARRRGELMAECATEGGLRGDARGLRSARTRSRTCSASMAWTWSSPTRMRPGSASSPGRSTEIERARQILSDVKVATHLVPVSAAFHSRFVGARGEPFLESLDSITFRTRRSRCSPTRRPSPIPTVRSRSGHLLAGQLARPVEFVGPDRSDVPSGSADIPRSRSRREVDGAGPRDPRRPRPPRLAVDASRGTAGNLYDLACSLATLAALGYAVDLIVGIEGDHGRSPRRRKPGLTVKICGANARPKDRTSRSGPAANQTTGSEPPVPRNIRRPPRRAAFFAGEGQRTRRCPRSPAATSRRDRPDHEPAGTDKFASTNGQAASHHPAHSPRRRRTRCRRPPTPDRRSRSRLHRAVVGTSRTPRKTWSPSRRLAEQTAELHRQFLEGQEKTQQTFLKLLEHQQRCRCRSPIEPSPTCRPGSRPRLELEPRIPTGPRRPLIRADRDPEHNDHREPSAPLPRRLRRIIRRSPRP